MERQLMEDAAVDANPWAAASFLLTVRPNQAEDGVRTSQYSRNASPSCARSVVLDAGREGVLMVTRRAGARGRLIAFASLAAVFALARPASGQG